MQTNHLIVYKHGSSTQLIVGRLVKLTRHSPRGWFDGDSRNNLEDEMDENEWMGVVDWTGLPFSSPGDSGSLIFAIEDGIYVPLRIHVGAFIFHINRNILLCSRS
ncbi:uncharacterized protein BDW43DRAFT_260932 [Aspergillus alliaceus]|uniref:uncharacterized protein n=1 Tax=Petromyces alliaceus TaxID=209559 RepID=UPI0012A4FEED|nr:uncharacterized protein BDW43DRAFT_260932 [Aspergillus alliaceus]KAB8239226.1 hypothetical protein BDW43DRAFT_260932 [Aspergillus alliaceus]